MPGLEVEVTDHHTQGTDTHGATAKSKFQSETTARTFSAGAPAQRTPQGAAGERVQSTARKSNFTRACSAGMRPLILVSTGPGSVRRGRPRATPRQQGAERFDCRSLSGQWSFRRTFKWPRPLPDCEQPLLSGTNKRRRQDLQDKGEVGGVAARDGEAKLVDKPAGSRPARHRRRLFNKTFRTWQTRNGLSGTTGQSNKGRSWRRRRSSSRWRRPPPLPLRASRRGEARSSSKSRALPSRFGRGRLAAPPDRPAQDWPPATAGDEPPRAAANLRRAAAGDEPRRRSAPPGPSPSHLATRAARRRATSRRPPPSRPRRAEPPPRRRAASPLAARRRLVSTRLRFWSRAEQPPRLRMAPNRRIATARRPPPASAADARGASRRSSSSVRTRQIPRTWASTSCHGRRGRPAAARPPWAHRRDAAAALVVDVARRRTASWTWLRVRRPRSPGRFRPRRARLAAHESGARPARPRRPRRSSSARL